MLKTCHLQTFQSLLTLILLSLSHIQTFLYLHTDLQYIPFPFIGARYSCASLCADIWLLGNRQPKNMYQGCGPLKREKLSALTFTAWFWYLLLSNISILGIPLQWDTIIGAPFHRSQISIFYCQNRNGLDRSVFVDINANSTQIELGLWLSLAILGIFRT